MNDPVLNRKMFRHTAQIKHNQIGKYQTGGIPQRPFTMGGMQQAAGSAIPRRNFIKDLSWLVGPGKFKAGLGMIKAGGQHAYKTFKGARAARKASGKEGTWWGTLPLTRTGKGPPSVYQSMIGKPISRHMMRNPKKYGAA